MSESWLEAFKERWFSRRALQPEDHIRRGESYSREGAPELAIIEYEKAIKLDPQHTWAYANKGSAVLAFRTYDEALQSLDQAIALGPQNAWALNERGRVYLARKQYDKAIAEFDQAARADPQHKWAHANKGSALRLWGK